MTDINESTVMEGDIESTAGNGDLQRKANRVIAFLSQITECLEETEMAGMNEILLGVFEVSKQKDSAETRERLMQLYAGFLEIVEFHSGISVTLIDQALRSFKMIAMDAEGLGNLVSEKYMEMIVIEYPSLSIDMKLTPELLRTYFRLLKDGSEEVCHIRLMVVGMYEVGKSTLVRNLCNQSIDDVESTEGIDILTNSCEVNDDGDWEISDTDEKDRFFKERLQVLVNKYGKRERTSAGHSSSFPTKESETATVSLPPQVESHGKDEEDRFAEQVIVKNRQKDRDTIVADLIEAEEESEIHERKPTVSIWDFAGQSVYYSTHHFFLNARSIYLVVLDLSKKLTDKVEDKDSEAFQENFIKGKTTDYPTCHDAFKFWMRSIYIYTEQKREHYPTYTPTIILVGTHKDEVTDVILKGRSHDQYKENYFTDALKCFEDKPVLALVHRKKFFVEKYDAKEAFLEIKKEIYEIAREKPFWQEEVPASFIRLEKVVNEKKKEKKKQFMSFDSLAETDEGLQLPTFETNDIKLFLKFQTAFGNVLYYNHNQLDKKIILNPQWIIDIFKIFITHKLDKDPNLSKNWTNFQTYGTLKDDLIDDMLKEKSDAEDAVRYMECLNVMVRPVEVNEDRTLACQSQENAGLFFQQYYHNKKKVKDFYIMPCMLPQRPEDDELKKLFAGFKINQKLPTLCIYIKKGFLPPFVFHSIIATCIKELPISTRSKKQLLFRGLGEFMLQSTTRLLIWFVDDFLHFTVIFEDKAETYKRKVEYCKDVKKCFEKLVLSVFNIHEKDTFDDSNKSELFEYLVKCPKCPQLVPFQDVDKSVPYKDQFICVTDIKSSKKVMCSTCNMMVTEREALGFWFHIGGQQSNSATRSQACLEDTLQDDILADLAEHIGDKIDQLREALVTKEEWFHIEKDYSFCQKTRAYQVLHRWKTAKKGEKSLQELLRNAMENCDFNLDLFDKIVAREEEDVTKEAVIRCMEGLDATKFHDENLWHDVMPRLITCIGNNHWLIGIRLNIPETDLRKGLGDHQPEQIKNILNVWWKQHAEFDVLIKALLKSGCDVQNVRKALMQCYSSSKHRIH